MKTIKELELELEKAYMRKSELLELDGVFYSERANNDAIEKIKLELELCKNNYNSNVPVLVDIDTNKIVSKKMLCKQSTFWVCINPEDKNDCIFISSSITDKKLSKMGLKKEMRQVKSHIIDIGDFKSMFVVVQYDNK